MSNEQILEDMFRKMASDVEGVLRRNLPLLELAGAGPGDLAVAIAKIAAGVELVGVSFVGALARDDGHAVSAVKAVRVMVDEIVEAAMPKAMNEAAAKRAELMGEAG